MCAQVLMEAGIKVNVEDAEGNTTLHVKSYGETGNLSELDAIDMLVANGADLTIRNNRVSDRADGAATKTYPSRFCNIPNLHIHTI